MYVIKQTNKSANRTNQTHTETRIKQTDKAKARGWFVWGFFLLLLLFGNMASQPYPKCISGTDLLRQ